MATFTDFRAWWDRDLGRFAPWKTSVRVLNPDITPAAIKIRIFTDKNCYSISAHEEWQAIDGLRPSYLGCIAISRRWRAGEDWHRGSDLADGRFTEETWRAILADILAYELVEISKDVREGRNRGAVVPPASSIGDGGHAVFGGEARILRPNG